MYFMWNSFVLHLFAFFYKVTKAWYYNNPLDWREDLKKVVFHVPFVMPLRNFYNAYLLYRMGFGLEEFKKKNLKRVEEIQHEAGICTMYESFTEGGPQSIVQTVIVLSTGRISFAQRISIPFSILSLAWSSSRVYFILRTPDDSDPDPELKMVLLRIFLWELMIVINSVLLWTMIGGLLGGYVFFGLFFSFLTLLGSLHLVERMNEKTSKRAPALGSDLAEQDFKLTSALTALWLPCVVGEAKSKFFLTSAIVSIVNKILLLVLSVLLAFYTDIDTNVFLLWCRKETFYESHNQSWVKPRCQFPQTNDVFPSCWNPDDPGIHQLVRVCGPPETERTLRIFLLAILTISSMLAILASFHLHQTSDYVRFFKKTKTFCCVDTKPVLHRSTVFALSANEDDHKKLEEILDTTTRKFQEEVNRPLRGETPLHVSTEANNFEGTKILLRAGAIPSENHENKLPQIGAHLISSEEIVQKLQESKDAGLVPNHILNGLRRQLRGNVQVPAELQKLLRLVGGGGFLARRDVSLWNYTTEDGPIEFCLKGYQFVEV